MKILKEGRKPEDKVYRASCRTCSTEIEFSRHEAKYNSDQRDGDYLSIGCPVCHNDIITGV